VAVEEQREWAPERAICLEMPAGLSVPIVADADRIGQVVTNYLTNALKYSPDARPVTVGLEALPAQARLGARRGGGATHGGAGAHLGALLSRQRDRAAGQVS
jgi:signal transduction histidine kinase